MDAKPAHNALAYAHYLAEFAAASAATSAAALYRAGLLSDGELKAMHRHLDNAEAHSGPEGSTGRQMVGSLRGILEAI